MGALKQLTISSVGSTVQSRASFAVSCNLAQLERTALTAQLSTLRRVSVKLQLAHSQAVSAGDSKAAAQAIAAWTQVYSQILDCTLLLKCH